MTGTEVMRTRTGTRAEPGEAEDLALVLWVEDVTDLAGLWWEDRFDLAALSCPRGVILPDWEVTVGAVLGTVGSVGGMAAPVKRSSPGKRPARKAPARASAGSSSAKTRASSNGTGGTKRAPEKRAAAKGSAKAGGPPPGSGPRRAGRRLSTPVRRYLDLIESSDRPGTPATLAARVAALDAKIAAASSLARLELIQQRLEVQARAEAAARFAETAAEVEAEFVAVVAEFSARRRISWEAWRQAGVPAAVLRRGGLTRSDAHLKGQHQNGRS